MLFRCSSTRGILAKIITLHLVLYLLFIPVFYANTLLDFSISHYLYTGLSYWVLRFVRFVLAVVAAVQFRRCNRSLCLEHEAERKNYMIGIGFAFLLEIILLQTNLPLTWCATFQYHLGLVDPPASVLWENTLSSDFVFSVLVCLGIVFAKAAPRKQTGAQRG